MTAIRSPDSRSVGDQRSDGGRETDSRNDHQVLVVGRGLTAAACAGFLEQAGLDPVLAAPEDVGPRGRPATVPLWEPGLALLERLGLRRPVERQGTRVDRLDCPSTGETWVTDSTGQPSLVVVRSEQLQTILDRQLRRRLRTPKQPVTTIRPTEPGVNVTFQGDIEEPFDVAIATTRTPVAVEPRDPTGAPLHTWTFDWPRERERPMAPTEAWATRTAAFVMPVAGGPTVHLIATPEAAPESAVDVAELESTFAPLFTSMVNPLTGLPADALTYRHRSRAIPASMHRERIALAGRPVRVDLPSGLLGPSLGLEDAWVLADELAYGPPGVADALDEYERRRRSRDRAIQSTIRTSPVGRHVSGTLSPLLEALRGSRALAFGHVTDGGLPALARSIPDRL